MNDIELTEQSRNYLLTILRREWYAQNDEAELDLLETLMTELGLLV